MNLNNVLILLKNDLNSIGEEILLAKEPDENDIDVDTFITNRSHCAVIHLGTKPPVPLVFTHKTRGFAYYLSQGGFIKPIDLYDAPFISDSSITWFASRAQASQFNPRVKVLSQQDQAACLIYKAIKKKKHKISRYEKIRKIIRNMDIEALQEAVQGLCYSQGEDKQFIKNANNAAQLLCSEESTSAKFETLTDQSPQSHITLTKRIGRKINTIVSILKNSHFIAQVRETKAPIVCCVGVDGAGKSTTIKNLDTSAQKLDCFKTRMETKTQYHPLTKFYMKKLKWVFSFIRFIFNKLKGARVESFLEYVEMRTNLFFIYFDTKQKIYSLIQKSKNGSMVVVDRWWLDFFIAQKNESVLQKHSTVLSKFLSLPHPDLFILVEVPTKISLQRRANENQRDISYKKEKLAAFMVQHFNVKLLRLNGSDEIEDNIKKIHRDLYKTWCNSLSRTKRPSASDTV